MPNLPDLDHFYLLVLFILPGLISVFVRSRFVTGKAPSHAENLLSYVALSVVYYAAVLPLVELALAIRDPWLLRVIVWLCLVLVGPTAFGLFLGAWAQREWGKTLARWIGLEPVHLIPAAWDWRFSKTPRDGQFILVTLCSGERVAGYFGTASFASSDPGERDLYVEEEWMLTDDGQWQERPDKVGVFIPFKEIRYIELWEPREQQ